MEIIPTKFANLLHGVTDDISAAVGKVDSGLIRGRTKLDAYLVRV